LVLCWDVQYWSSEVQVWSSEVHDWSSEVLAWSSEVHEWSSEVHAWSSEVLAWSSEVHAWSSEVLAWSSEEQRCGQKSQFHAFAPEYFTEQMRKIHFVYNNYRQFIQASAKLLPLGFVF
ncbi:MAG: hypothetical protein LBV26_08275, partial [Bacteroidales bacterium]|nr:hypothetical protein [Bacteroidales bacterium]